MRSLFLLTCALACGACAQLHHVQLGDIDAAPGTPFDLKVSETGLSTAEAGIIAKELVRSASRRAAQNAGNLTVLVELFQMGPRTGNPVWDADYAEGLAASLQNACPDGQITGLQSVREARRYPVISGEIVHISGTCIHHPSKGHAS